MAENVINVCVYGGVYMPVRTNKGRLGIINVESVYFPLEANDVLGDDWFLAVRQIGFVITVGQQCNIIIVLYL